MHITPNTVVYFHLSGQEAGNLDSVEGHGGGGIAMVATGCSGVLTQTMVHKDTIGVRYLCHALVCGDGF